MFLILASYACNLIYSKILTGSSQGGVSDNFSTPFFSHRKDGEGSKHADQTSL